MKRANNLVERFKIELLSKLDGANQSTTKHRELPPLGHLGVLGFRRNPILGNPCNS